MAKRLVVVSALAPLLPVDSAAQTLDRAVSAQLEIVTNLQCERLLGPDDPNVVLTGELRNICSRGGSVGSSSSTGGGAGTPPSAPSVVEERRREEQRGFFATGEYGSLDRDVTSFEDGYQSNLARLTLGVDFGIRDSWVAGGALEISRQDGDFDGGGDFEIDEYTVIGFGSYRHADDMFVDLYGAYGVLDHERRRPASFSQFFDDGSLFFTAAGTPRASFDAGQLSGGVQFGYDHSIDNVTFGPRAGVEYSRTRYDSYDEFETADSGLALTFHDDSITSVLSTLGLEGSVSISTSFGVVLLQESLSWKHEFANEQRDVEVSFVEDLRAKRFTYETEPPDVNYYEFSAGVVFVTSKLQAFVNYVTLNSHSFIHSGTFSAGIRKQF